MIAQGKPIAPESPPNRPVAESAASVPAATL
jgi:hypothetical protein